jgi:hypothetical protein
MKISAPVVRKTLFFSILMVILSKGYAQPIPVEITGGNRYASVDVNFTKKFSVDTKWGFFHMNTLQAYYENKSKNSFIIQDLLFYEPFRNFRVAAGAFYGKPGFNTTAGFQYNIISKKVYFLFAPRINITRTPSYDFMTILSYRTPLNSNLGLFAKFKMLNLFDANTHIKSYQWFRAGLEAGKLQFGLAVNIDEFGPGPVVETNFGLFVRKEIP